MNRPDAILPGATLGILGSGQLGRMLALAAREMGYRVRVFSPDRDSPAGQVSDIEIVGAYEDLNGIREFARPLAVLTFEFENIPSLTTAAAAEVTLVRPDGRVLHVTQHRLREKSFLAQKGFPTTPFRPVVTLDDLVLATQALGFPGVLKTANFGYDGKGQRKLVSASEVLDAHAGLGGKQGIYEAWVDYVKEVSVVAARGLDGAFAAFPVFENRHVDHILDVTVAPADISPSLDSEATTLAQNVLEAMEVVGLLTVEMFVTTAGRLLINELAPRTHNSGHLTLDAAVTSQFEQQVRAICGLPLGSIELRQPAAMANLLGDLWLGREPDWAAGLADPAVKLHLYGKAEPRAGRKMGHLTVIAPTGAEALTRVQEARRRLIHGRSQRREVATREASSAT